LERRPEYVGYEEGGQLTEAVRRRPYSVVLFDEIEKGSFPMYSTCLLQLLDDGRLTEWSGTHSGFSQYTGNHDLNLGSELWLGGKAGGVTRDAITQVLQAHFRPEFLNRIDEIIIFHSLSRTDLVQVVDIQLRQLLHCWRSAAIGWLSTRRRAPVRFGPHQ